MTLTTHGVVGASAMVASVSALGVTPSGIGVGLAAGFVSHFALDAIPHWAEGDILLSSTKKVKGDLLQTDMLRGKDALKDLALVSIDGLLGLGIALFVYSYSLFHFSPLIPFLGAGAGEAPDALQFVYFKLKPKFMEPLQRFHGVIQTEIEDWRFLSIEVLIMIGAVCLVVAFA